MIAIVFLFALSFLFSSDIQEEEIKLSSTHSVFHAIQNSDIYFHIQYSELSLSDHFSYGVQWWPSNNLYLTGLFSNLIIEEDNSLYHHIALGYSNPDWKIKEFTPNVIEFGVHRLRYFINKVGPEVLNLDFKNKIYRWFHTGLKTRFSYKKINFGVGFTRFFYNKWATNRYTLSMVKTLNGNISINVGTIYDEFNSFKPYIGFSIGL
jgi:hypothetical protein